MDNLTFAERLLLTLIPALATVGAAWAVAYFSIKKFYAERLWEKKLEVANRIFETLADLHSTLRDLDRCFQKKMTFGNEDEIKKFKESAFRAAESMDRLELIGPFLVPLDTWRFIEELHETVRQLSFTNSDSIILGLLATQNCISRIREWANTELQKEPPARKVFKKIRRAFEPFE